MTLDSDAFYTEENDISSILLLQLGPIGDTLFSTPAVKALRNRFPEAMITALVWSSAEGILRGNPDIDRIISCNETRGLIRIILALRRESFDLIIGLSSLGSWLTLFCQGRYRIGFNSKHLGWAYSFPVPDRRDEHAVYYCLDIAASAGAIVAKPALELEIDPEDQHFADSFLSERGVSEKDLLVGIHPGGRFFPAKRWSTKGYAEVADRLIRDYGAKVIILGGKDDVAFADEIESLMYMRRDIHIAAGRFSLRHTAAILKRCDLFIGNDSAPQHIAAAVKTPVIALFGPTDPENFRPLGDKHIVIRKDLPCSPCFKWLGGPLQYLTIMHNPSCKRDCMLSITPDDVMEAVKKQLLRIGKIKKGLSVQIRTEATK